MLKLYLLFAICMYYLPTIASSVVIEIRPQNTPVIVQAFLPIDGYSNPFLPTEFVIDKGIYTLSIHESKTIAIAFYVKNYSFEIPIYVTPDEDVRIIIEPESKGLPVTFEGLNSECHYNFYKHSAELRKEYSDLFISFPEEITDSLILFTFRNEAKKMRNLFGCLNDSLFAYFQQDMCLTMMGSLHRKYRGNKDVLKLYDLIIDKFHLDHGVRGSLQSYGYFYYLSFEKPKNKAIQPSSSFFTTHDFLFSISNIDDLSFMLQMQILVVIKMNGFTSFDAKCEAFNDIKDIVLKSEVNMATFFMEYFPERSLCKN